MTAPLRLDIRVAFAYDFAAPTDVLLQLVAAADSPGQEVTSEALVIPGYNTAQVAGHHAIGTRAWLRADGRLDLTYAATVEVTRTATQWADLPATPLVDLPGDVTEYLFASRYCEADLFERFVLTEFPGLVGGALIAAMRDWIAKHFVYASTGSASSTTARDAFVARRGVCRDYAHVLVAMARAVGIPARFVSVYAPRVTPPDFHAVAQVWLGGAWHLADATGMAQPHEMAVIGVGRDAADVAFLTAFGDARFVHQSVAVSAV